MAERHRIDAWLKHVCLLKQRSEAADACKGGHVKINGLRVKPAAAVREGDVIVEFAGNKVQNLEDLANLLGSKKPGDEVEIMVLRTGKPVTLKAILRARS